MRRAWQTMGLTVATWLALVPTVRADFTLCTPWVRVQVGAGGVYVQAPGVTVNVPRAPAPVTSAAQPLPRAIEPVPEVPLPPPAPLSPEGIVPTPSEFARALIAQPGRHEAVVLHPATGRPVAVSFTLPPGTPRQVRVHRWRVVMDYGRRNVTIAFLRNGGVRVRD
jgi:hypothetical protein